MLLPNLGIIRGPCPCPETTDETTEGKSDTLCGKAEDVYQAFVASKSVQKLIALALAITLPCGAFCAKISIFTAASCTKSLVSSDTFGSLALASPLIAHSSEGRSIGSLTIALAPC